MSGNRILFFLTIFIALCFSKSAYAGNTELESTGRSVINLLDYIQRDYHNAVSDGQVINEFEMSEMREFSELLISQFSKLSSATEIPDSLHLIGELKALRDSVGRLASAKVVGEACKHLKERFLELELVPDSPRDWPDLTFGKSVYDLHCYTCHGSKGDGKGQLAVGLEPAPSNFLDPELSANISPFQVYNTVSLGIQGTSMQSFGSLTEKERWAVSFYILSLGRDDKGSFEKGDEIVSLSDASVMSNAELVDHYGKDLNVSAIRNYELITTSASTLQRSRELLEQSYEAYAEERKELAFDLALKAYLEGVEPVEQKIAASDANMVGELERSMMTFRNMIGEDAPLEELDAQLTESYRVIDEAEMLLQGQEKGLFFTTFISASILIREGLEAFLIIISIIAILKSLDARKAIQWVHYGWIGALLVGATGWFFVDSLVTWDMSSREMMEGLLTLFAAGVLIFMGFWLHSKTEIGKWRKFVEEKITALVNQESYFGLALFSFIVVFREAFESVIFLSTIAVDADGDSRGIWLGLLIAAALVTFLSYSILKLFKKINLRKVFLYTSAIIVVLAVILSGEGIHALQEAGMISVNSISWNIRMGLLGIYPTVETFVAQLLTILLITGLWLYNKRRSI